jgi:DNA-binding MarR family transcriptional regulator
LQSEQHTSSPTPAQRAQWRVFLETALAVIDILDAEMQAERGITLTWYDALIHLEDAPDGLGMTELANRILFSKSGLTRVIDRMEAAGLVRRERPPEDRRVVKVLITAAGLETLNCARTVHRRGIQEHFVSHVAPSELTALASTLESVREHVRPLRPGRISRSEPATTRRRPHRA